MVETLAGLAAGTLRPQPQNHAGATFAPLLDREDGRMAFASHTAHELYNRWRGFQPWPGAFTTLDGKKLIVHRMAVAAAPDSVEAGPPAPGQLQIDNHRIFVRCAGSTWIELLELQLEGKKRLPAAEFLRGNPLVSGSRLGSPNP
jgi:methionyl-tRNA formyltransferase